MAGRVRWLSLGVAALAAGTIIAGHLRTRFDVAVTTAPVTIGPIMREVVAAGTVQAEKSVQVGSQVSGVVESLDADFNSVVRKGDVIARIDPSLYDEQLKQAHAAGEAAEADVALLRVDADDSRQKLDRAQSLAMRGLVTAADLAAARAALDEAQASLHAGEAALRQANAAARQAEVDLKHTVIRAPAAGVVIDRRVEVGQTVAASVETPVLFTIASDLDTVQLEVQVDEGDVGWLETGDRAVFKVDAYPREIYHGTLAQIRVQPVLTAASAGDPRADTHQATAQTAPNAGSVSYTAVLDVPNPGDHLLPGMTAVVTIDGAHRSNAVRIPNAALGFRPTPDMLQALGSVPPGVKVEHQDTENRDVREVWKYDGQRLSPVFVRAGLSDEARTEVVSGSLSAGDRLATSAKVLEHRTGLWSGL